MKKFTDYREIISSINEKNIEFVNLLFPDILGDNRGFSIPSDEIETVLEDGKGFDGSSVQGLVPIEESDIIAKPDPTTFRTFPWWHENQNDKYKVGMMFCDILKPNGDPYEGDTRYVLKRMLRKARGKGFDNFKTGPELEFFYFPDNKEPKLIDKGGYFSMGSGNDPHASLRQKTMLNLRYMGIECELDHHEVAPGQQEIDLKYDDALEMADKSMLFKFVVKETAKKNGVYATFMPKPLTNENGNGMHVHQSLWRNGNNIFFDENGEYNLSEEARKYMSGLFHNINEITSITNQWMNSYKRLVPGFEAPVYHVWGQKNRSALIRVPEYKVGSANATRIELRNPDPGCNPYLAFSVMLAAGLDGIENDYELPEPHEDNVYKNGRGLKTLPTNLMEALEETKKSKLVKETLGSHLYNKHIENKETQIEKFNDEFFRKVTNYEIKHNFPRL